MSNLLFTQAVREVGDWIRSERREFNANKVETKALNSLVSYVDQQAELMLIERLTTALPGSGVLGEEGGSNWIEGGSNWIIDPLDGTTNFIHDLPPYAVSVALMRGRDLVWAAVYELGQGRMLRRSSGAELFATVACWTYARALHCATVWSPRASPTMNSLTCLSTSRPCRHALGPRGEFAVLVRQPQTLHGWPTGAFKAFLSTDWLPGT